MPTDRDAVPAVITNINNCTRVCVVTQSRDRVIVDIRRHQPIKQIKLELLNARLIGNKSVQIADCITSRHFDFFTVVETWHDSENCPAVISCRPNGYWCVELARTRSDKAESTTAANHGGVYIFFRSRFTVHRISLPHHQSVEVLAVYVQGGESISSLSSSTIQACDRLTLS